METVPLAVDDLRDLSLTVCACTTFVQISGRTAAVVRSGLLTEDAVLPGTVCGGLKHSHAESSIFIPNLVLKWIDRMNFE